MSRVLLSVESVSKRFGGLRAVHQVTFQVFAGEVLFIVGPNGAGKTTLFDLITSACPPDSGTIRLEDREIQGLGPARTARFGIGRTFQIVKPLRNLTVLENVMLGAFLRCPRVDAARSRAREVLSFLELEAWASAPAHQLSLPMLKRLEVARALATGPKLMLLDEVVAGLPTSEALALASLLQRLPEWGVTAVGGVEHVMQVVMKIANRVVVIDHGELIAEGTPEDVVHRPEVIEAYLGSKYRERLARGAADETEQGNASGE